MERPNRNERRNLTERYRVALSRVSAALFLADPIGIADGNPHPDEYAAEAQRILARSDTAKDAADLSRTMRGVFVEQFSEADAGPASKYEDLATELWPTVEELRGPEKIISGVVSTWHWTRSVSPALNAFALSHDFPCFESPCTATCRWVLRRYAN